MQSFICICYQHASYTPAVAGKTKTTLGVAGTFQGLLNDAADLAWLSGKQLALQKVETRNGYIAKIDLETGDKIVLRTEDDDVYSLVTAFNILED